MSNSQVQNWGLVVINSLGHLTLRLYPHFRPFILQSLPKSAVVLVQDVCQWEVVDDERLGWDEQEEDGSLRQGVIIFEPELEHHEGEIVQQHEGEADIEDDELQSDWFDWLNHITATTG